MLDNLVGLPLPYDGRRPPTAVFNAEQGILTVYNRLRDEDLPQLPSSWFYTCSRSSDVAFRLYSGYARLRVMTESEFVDKYPNKVFHKFLNITN
jgi:hypothetical protein